MANLVTYKNFHDYGLPWPSANDKEQIMHNIRYLYQKIEKCTRNITYFDLYKIASVLNNDAEFESKVNELPPYSSMILNTPVQLTGTNTSYNIGDIVVKNPDGTHEVIAAQRGGIFYPSSIQRINADDDNYTYNFMFSYQSAEPNINILTINDKNTTPTTPGATPESGSDGVWDVADLDPDENGNIPSSTFAKNILFQGLKSSTPKAPYNQVIKLQDGATNIGEIDDILATHPYDEDGNINNDLYISPTVHCYNTNNGVLEEVYSDLSVELVDKQITQKDGTQTTVKAYKIILNIETILCDLVVVK